MDAQKLQRVSPSSTLAANLRPSFASMLLNAACQDYFNLRLETAAVRLRWLTEHLEPITAASNDPAPVIAPSNPRVGARPEDFREFAVCKARAESLLRQLSLGLDFHGQVANHVTLLSERFYLDTLAHLMPLAQNIEDAYAKYAQAKSNKGQAVEAALRSKEEYAKVMEVKKSERTRAVGQSPQMLSSLASLDKRRSELWTQVHTAESSFRFAVQSKAQGCDFGRVVAIAAACATLVASAGTAAAAWGSAGSLFTAAPVTGDNKPIPEGFAGAGYVVTTLSKVVTSTSEFADEGKKLGKLIDGPPGEALPGLPSDEAKILTSAEDLQKQLVPFLNEFSEAVAFRQLIQEFVEVCTARNNKVLEYNNHLALLRTLETETQQAELEASRFQDTIARNNDPFLAEVSAMMEHIWHDSMAYVVRTLVRVHSAYKYYSLDDGSTLALNDLSVATLKAAQFNLWKKYVDEKELAGSPSSVLDRVPVSLSALVGPKGLRKLQDEHQLTFALSPDHPQFANLCKVLISTVDVSMFAQGQLLPDYGVVLVHHGHALIFDAQGRPHVYSHVPIRASYGRQGGRAVVYSNPDRGGYVGISPYGPWTLEFDSNTRVQNLSDIVLGMSGFGRARDSQVRA